MPKSLHRETLEILVDALPDPDAGDHHDQHSRSHSQHPHEGLDLPHAALQGQLFFLHVKGGVIKEELIILVHGERAAIDEEDDQNHGDGGPSNQQHR